jgi:predicted adenylyl cyclase CyaB
MKNLELKARCNSLIQLRQKVKTLGAEYRCTMRQTDTYFNAPKGRLKLREIARREAELIHYERSDRPESRYSDYQIYTVFDAAALKEILAKALGVSGVVEKRRELWIYGNTRIHLDEVSGLGDFVELETVMANQTEETAYAEHEWVKTALGIEAANVEAVSYSDLLFRRQHVNAS